MRVLSIDVPELGNRTYLIHDGEVAVVIDPSRRIQEVLDLAAENKVVIRAVFETHIHNDYVTGGLALAEKLAVPYYVSADEPVQFTREKISPDQVVTVSKLQVTALATPGHTHTHLGYLVQQPNEVPAFFSGGSLLYGAVGRTDLVSSDDTLGLARDQYKTAQFLRSRLDEQTELYPTHGFGSFCAATETEHIAVSTLSQQLRTNPVYTAEDEVGFAESLVAGLDDYPAYYAYMAPANLVDPHEPDLAAPAHLTREAALAALHTGVAIIDMRTRTAYASQHITGTYNVELSNDLATYVGWLIAWETPIILVAQSAQEVTDAQEQLSLIGRAVTGGQLTAQELLPTDASAATYPVRTFADFAAQKTDKESERVLDVRRTSEWKKSHIPDALHIPLHELPRRLDEVRADTQVWVHCASGFRAAIAASILEGAGKQVVLIDDRFTNATKAGLMPVKKQPFVDEVATGAAQLVDVRDNAEWKAGHAEYAVHVPLGMILEGDTQELDEGKRVYLYCDSGERSGMAENFLAATGFDAVNIGGLSDWIQAGGAYE